MLLLLGKPRARIVRHLARRLATQSELSCMEQSVVEVLQSYMTVVVSPDLVKYGWPKHCNTFAGSNPWARAESNQFEVQNDSGQFSDSGTSARCFAQKWPGVLSARSRL